METIVLCSDSHGNLENVKKLNEFLLSHNFKYLFYLGDGIGDLSHLDPNIKVYSVHGNIDENNGYPPLRYKIINDFFQYSILLTHGHFFKVKHGYDLIYNFCKDNKINIAVFGHTHHKEYFKRDDIHFINPGALFENNFGILKLDKNSVEIFFNILK